MTAKNTKFVARLLTLLAVAYGIVAFVYAMYGAFTGTGLSGYLVALQLQWLSRASILVTAVSAVTLLSLPAIAAVILVGRIWPEIGRLMRESFVQSAPVTRQPTAASHLSWRAIVAVTASILLIGFITAGALFIKDRHDRAAGIQDINLDLPAASALPSGTAFVRVRGRVAADFIAGFEQQSTRSSTPTVHVFAPIVPASWKPTDEVRYLVHYVSRGTSEPVLPASWQAGDGSLIPGSFGDQLPVYVAQHYASQRLNISPSYRVIDYQDLPDGEAPESYAPLIALGLATFVALIAFGSLAGGKLIAEKMTR